MKLLAQNIVVNGGSGTGTNAGNLILTAPQKITGSYLQTNIGSLVIGIGPGSTGRLDISGTVTLLDAALVLQTLNSNAYAGPGSLGLQIGQQFPVIIAKAGIRGGLAEMTQPDLAAGTRFDALYSPNSISLVLTPRSYANMAALGLATDPATSVVGSGLDAGRPLAGLVMTPGQAGLYAPLYVLASDQIARFSSRWRR